MSMVFSLSCFLVLTFVYEGMLENLREDVEEPANKNYTQSGLTINPSVGQASCLPKGCTERV